MSALVFRQDIQGLRAIAVLAVILFHFNPKWLPGGFIGVDIFFVISGFLISTVLLNRKLSVEKQFTLALKVFYLSRIRRIFPAYFFMLVVVSFLASLLFIFQDFGEYQEGLRQAIFFNANQYFSNFGSYFSTENHEQPLLHTWSLAVEIQFYLLAPFFILLLPNKWLYRILWGGVIVLTLVAEYRLRVNGAEQSTYYSLYARLPQFFAGVLAAIYLFERHELGKPKACSGWDWMSILGISLITISIVFQPSLGVFPGIAALVPVLGVVILLIRPSKGVVGGILNWSFMGWIGVLSYSLYLWHWPVLAFIRYFTGSEELSVGYGCLFLCLTLVLSVLSYHFVENTFRKVKQGSIKKTTKWSFLLLATVIVVQSSADLNRYFSPSPLAVEHLRYADPKSICHSKVVGNCLRGDLSSTKEILVVGDSHAAMLNHFFDDLGNQLGFKARIVTASSCLTIRNFDVNYIEEWARPDCVKQIDEVMKYIDTYEYIALAGMWSYQLGSEKNRDAIRGFLSDNKQKEILLFKQVPEMVNSPLRVLRFNHLGLFFEQKYNDEWSESNLLLDDLIDDRDSIVVLNAKEYIKGVSLPYMNDQLIYFDESHLNQVGSSIYAAAAKNRVSAWLNR